MKDTFYFPHDYEPTSDPKMIAFIGNYGGLGYGIFWRIIEMLHSDDNHKLAQKGYIHEAVAKQMQISVEQVQAMVQDLVNKYELLSSDGQFFWSNRVLRNIEDREKKKAVKAEAGRLGGIQSGLKRSKTKQNEALLEANEANEAKERKGKERKGNIISTNVDMSKHEFRRFLEFYEKESQRKIKPLPERHKKFQARRKTWSVADLERAAKNILEDKFLQGENEGGKVYGDLDYILRNDKTIEKYLNPPKKWTPSQVPSVRSIEL